MVLGVGKKNLKSDNYLKIFIPGDGHGVVALACYGLAPRQQTVWLHYIESSLEV